MTVEGRWQHHITRVRDTIITLRGEYGLSTKLARIAELSQQDPRIRFTSLAHLLDIEMLKTCHAELKRDKAPGIDEVTKQEYERQLSENLDSLVQRLKTKSYRPLPVKRVYIPKPGSDKKRPLGIPAYEDKIVQLALWLKSYAPYMNRSSLTVPAVFDPIGALMMHSSCWRISWKPRRSTM